MADFIKYINELFGITSATSAPILITVLVFATGQILIWVRAFLNGLIKRNKTRRIFTEVINSATVTTRKQERIFHESETYMNFERISDLVLKKIEFFQPKLLDEIGFNNSRNAFFGGIENLFKFRNDKVRSRAFVKCWEIMRTVDYWVDAGYSKIDEFGSKYNRYNDQRNDALKKLGYFNEKLIQSYLGKEIDLSTEEGSYIFELLQINSNFQKLQDRRPQTAHKKLVIPLRILNRKFLKIRYITEMNSYLLEASICYENMYNILSKQRLQYTLYACNFRYNYRTFQKALKILKAKC
ncbi:MAG: hypothetical protein ABJN36_08985 [Cyclobacteriaceae bacterium]